MPPHILAVFNQLFDELKSMKQQQWTITNYGLLILAAIYAVKLSGVPHSWRLDNVHNKFFTSNETRGRWLD
jgi:hypothetical protein